MQGKLNFGASRMKAGLTVKGLEIVITASEKLFTPVAEVIACDSHNLLPQQARFPGPFNSKVSKTVMAFLPLVTTCCLYKG